MKHIFMVLAGLLMSVPLQSQSISPEVLASSGTVYTSSAAQLSWTLGESLVASRNSTSNMLTEGFQQGRVIVTAISPALDDFQVNIYPNPTADQLHVELPQQTHAGFRMELINVSGQIMQVHNSPADQLKASLSMTDIAAGTYFLRITDQASQHQRNFQVRKIR